MSYLSNTVNPQAVHTDVASYYIYAQDKTSRKQVQYQGKQMATNVNFLHRRAKQQVKQLNKTQLNLVNLYSKTLNKYDQQRKKAEYKKVQDQKLRQLKNISSLNRYLHSLRKQQSFRDIFKRNQTSAKTVKQHHKNSQEKFRQSKQKELYNLKMQNQQRSRLRRARNQFSRQQSLNQKKRLSATINGDLRLCQNKLIDNQIQRINNLTRKQQELVEIVQRSKRQKEKIQGKLQKTKEMQYEQIYNQLLNLDSRKNSSRKAKSKSRSRSNNIFQF